MKVIVEGFITLDQDIAGFKEHLRHFLVQIREATGDDTGDLYLEDREQILKRAAEEKRKIQMSVPGKRISLSSMMMIDPSALLSLLQVFSILMKFQKTYKIETNDRRNERTNIVMRVFCLYVLFECKTKKKYIYISTYETKEKENHPSSLSFFFFASTPRRMPLSITVSANGKAFSRYSSDRVK